MPGPARLLVLVRHAQAESAAPTDAERPLSDRGRRDARAAGAWLTGHHVEPRSVRSSAALRAQQTAELLAVGAGWSLVPTAEEELYSAGPEETLALVRSTLGEVDTLVLVGHNPTIAELARLLDDGAGEEQARTALAAGYATCGITLLGLGTAWEALAPGSTRVRAHHAARG